MLKHALATLVVATAALPIASGCGTEVAEEPVLVRPAVEASIAAQDLMVGAKGGDWCGNSHPGDADYITNRSIGAFKCAASALCGTLGPAAALACSTALTSLLEAAKDDPNGITILWSFISGIAQYGYLDLVSNPYALANLNPQLWASLVKAYGEAGARAFSTKVLNALFKFDQRTLPVQNVSKLTYAGLLLSCAEAIRGACDLVVNTVYAIQESHEAWIAPDWKGSVPGCSKPTAVAVTDYTYVFWDGAESTFHKCVTSCRQEQDSCGGDSQKACHWWNACVNYCASDKLGTLSSPLVSGYKMQCQPPAGAQAVPALAAPVAVALPVD